MAVPQRATPPSAWAVQNAMTAAARFADQLRTDDPEMDHADLLLALDSETDAFDVLRLAVRASLEADADAETIGARIKILADRKARFVARKESCRALVAAMMDAFGTAKVADAEFTVSVSTGPRKVIVGDIAELPEAFVRVVRSPDMQLIAAALKADEAVPGCSFGNGSQVLTIRVA